MSYGKVVPVTLDDWDPLSQAADDPDLLVAAQKREIHNILKSYTGYHDLFSEMIQNALDAVERRLNEGEAGYSPQIWIEINLNRDSISVTDNGCAMSLAEFRSFLKPNFSFKDGDSTRGNKGVGATYLAYGFNHLEVSTKRSRNESYAGTIENGRNWLDDSAGIVTRPKVVTSTTSHAPFESIDRGTSMTLILKGTNVRPRTLSYFGAAGADQWLKILQAHTPLGGVYICGEKAPPIKAIVQVIAGDDQLPSSAEITAPRYLFPHEVIGNTEDLRDYRAEQARREARGLDLSKVPRRYTNLNGLWGEWDGDEILSDRSPVKPRLDDDEIKLLKDTGFQVYVFQGFSTDLWDDYNDRRLQLRKGTRILRGGLKLATRNMPQGNSITIPLTESIGLQTITHVLVHFQNAEPDLGRKGFQPEHTRLAEKIAVSCVRAFKPYYGRLLRKKTGAPNVLKQMHLSQWIDSQKEHERANPLRITGPGLFAPQEELPIRSLPCVEQDVVALFNQMLSAGIIRGVELLASSQFEQYDGLYRLRMEPPFDKFVRQDDDNPLGVDAEVFAAYDEVIESRVEVLEYKYSLDALIEEFQNGEKNPDDIGLAVAWEMGTKWKESFAVFSYLDPDNVHHRQFHGFTHSFSHAISGTTTFQVIILKELVSYLTNRKKEEENQRRLYGEEGENGY